MSISYSHCVLLGHVTRDPEIRHTPQGKTVAEFGMAVNRNFTVDGQKREETSFFDIVLWDKLATIAEAYVRRGHPVLVAGRLQQDSWEDKNTHEKRSRVRIVGETMQLLGTKPPQGSAPAPSSAVRQPSFRGPVDTDTEPDNIPYA